MFATQGGKRHLGHDAVSSLRATSKVCQVYLHNSQVIVALHLPLRGTTGRPPINDLKLHASNSYQHIFKHSRPGHIKMHAEWKAHTRKKFWHHKNMKSGLFSVRP